MSGTDDDETGETESGDSFKSFLLVVSRSELIWSTADIVVATKVYVVLEVLLGDHFVVLAQESRNTIDESVEANILALGLVSEETIYDVVATWGLSAHEDDSDLLWLVCGFGLEELLVDLLELIVWVLVPGVGQQIILDFDEVVGVGLLLQVREESV